MAYFVFGDCCRCVQGGLYCGGSRLLYSWIYDIWPVPDIAVLSSLSFCDFFEWGNFGWADNVCNFAADSSVRHWCRNR